MTGVVGIQLCSAVNKLKTFGASTNSSTEILTNNVCSSSGHSENTSYITLKTDMHMVSRGI